MLGTSGELSREAVENCTTHRIHQDTDLYNYILHGNHTMKHYNDVHFIHTVPTMIKHGNLQFLVYSKCGEADCGPATYFYDIQESMTICRIRGAEIFLDYFPDPNDQDNDHEGYVSFVSNT